MPLTVSFKEVGDHDVVNMSALGAAMYRSTICVGEHRGGTVNRNWGVPLISINHNSPLKSTGWELHFPHPCSAPSIEQKCSAASLDSHYPTVMKSNDSRRVVMSKRSKCKGSEGFLMERGVFVRLKRHK